jgi:hypothetical protein
VDVFLTQLFSQLCCALRIKRANVYNNQFHNTLKAGFDVIYQHVFNLFTHIELDVKREDKI